MSSVAVAGAAVPTPAGAAGAGRTALIVGGVGLALSAVGFVVSTKAMAFSYLTALTFWLAVALGMLFFIMIHHVFDAGWGIIVRRQAEHGIAAFPWLGVLFIPLLLLSLFYKQDILWKWMNPANVAGDSVYQGKAVFLNTPAFMIRAVLYFGLWSLIAMMLRRNSFNQDVDGDVKWTHSNRAWAAGGLVVTALSSSFAAIDWIKALDYHWFSTMFGVWYFALSMRVALSVLAIVCILWAARGHLDGLLRKAHLHDIGKLMFAFTVFNGYIAFVGQYFIIYNANIPEETYWYTIREIDPLTGGKNSWWWVTMVLIFCHFFAPFLFLIFYKTKVNPKLLGLAAIWILAFALVDLWYNITPSMKVTDEAGHAVSYVTGQATLNAFEMIPVPFLGMHLIWTLVALVGIGGVCAWAYLRSFARTKIIPIHDPRILESVHHHE